MLLLCATLFGTLAALHTCHFPSASSLRCSLSLSFCRGHMHDEITRHALGPLFIMYEWVYPLGARCPTWWRHQTREGPWFCQPMAKGCGDRRRKCATEAWWRPSSCALGLPGQCATFSLALLRQASCGGQQCWAHTREENNTPVLTTGDRHRPLLKKVTWCAAVHLIQCSIYVQRFTSSLCATKDTFWGMQAKSVSID